MRGYQCTGCKLSFSGVTAFDRHRTGTYQPNTRRCMTVSEMSDAGLVLHNDVWGLPMSDRAREYFERLKSESY